MAINSEGLITSIENIPNVKYDLIIIASPTHQHLESLIYALRLKSEIIIIEKPITDSIESLKEIKNHISNIDKKVIVNYYRNFDDSYEIIKFLNANNILINIEFQGGIHNNISHCSHLF